MKKYLAGIILFLCAVSSSAQTVALSPITKVLYCVDDTLTVVYSATGSFAFGNVFSLQLSDENGSFTSPTNAGTSTLLSDTFRYVLSDAGLHFRARVITSAPPDTSANNGTDIEVLNYPIPTPTLVIGKNSLAAVADSVSGAAIMSGQTARFAGTSFPPVDTFIWTFFNDASVFSDTGDTVNVSYGSPGLKSGTITAINRAGCGTTLPFNIRVLDCNPIIPSTAEIVTGNESSTAADIWIKSGGIDTMQAVGYPQTFFVDPGGTVYVNSDEEGNTYYVQSGGVLLPSIPLRGTIVSSAGTQYSVQTMSGLDTLSCADLTFAPQDGVAKTSPIQPFHILQLGSRVTILSSEFSYRIRILDLLGQEVYRANGSNNSEVDLSSLRAGIYFAVVESGDVQTLVTLSFIP